MTGARSNSHAPLMPQLACMRMLFAGVYLGCRGRHATDTPQVERSDSRYRCLRWPTQCLEGMKLG